MNVTRARSAVVIISVVAVVVLAVGVVFVWWQTQSRQSVDALLDRVETHESSLESHMTEYIEAAKKVPSSAGAGGTSGQVAAATTAVQEMNATAIDALTDGIVAQHDLDALALTDGSPLDDARDAYTAHVEAWQTQWEALGNLQLGTPVSNQLNDAEINATFTIAERVFADLDLTDAQRERVEAIFTD